MAAGVTTVREAGGSDLGVKEAQAKGLVAGPRMLISITILSQTGGHGDRWQVCGAHLPGFMGITASRQAQQRRRRPGGDAAQGP